MLVNLVNNRNDESDLFIACCHSQSEALRTCRSGFPIATVSLVVFFHFI